MKGDDNVLAGILWVAYLVGLLISNFYFWWLYSKGHGFLSTVFLGPFVSTVKAIVWPLFVLF